MTMLFARVKNHCKNNAFEKLKLKSSDSDLDRWLLFKITWQPFKAELQDYLQLKKYVQLNLQNMNIPKKLKT